MHQPEHSSSLPVVAIVGRPNVGKSTLFNRLLGRRKAITDPTPGVTRDPVRSDAEILGTRCLLIDTGGVLPGARGLDKLVAERSYGAINRAALILFVVEPGDLTAADQEFLEELRPFAKKTLLVVNKVDNSKRETEALALYELGLPELFMVAAAHGIGMPDLEEAIADRLATADAPNPEAPKRDAPADMMTRAAESVEETVKLALIGKPNTGKSTLANALVNEDVSIVSDVPGTTRDAVEAGFVHKGVCYRIVDTAGIRRKRSVDTDVEYYSVNRAVKAVEEADIALLLIDSVEGFSEQDKKIAAVTVRRGKGVVLVLNKWDLRTGTPNEFNAVVDRVRFVFPILSFAPVVPISAKDQTGLPDLLDTVNRVRGQLVKRVGTAKLNEALGRWVDKNPAPAGRRDRFRVKYITQAQVAPLKFVAFVNKKDGFPDSYAGYLRNQIRKDFGFTDVPFTLDLRS